MELVKKLGIIQQKLNAPKSQHNKFGNYNYRNCEDIMQALKPLLGDCIVLLNDEVTLVSDRIYIKATATIKDNSDSISVSAFAREELSKKGMDSAQLSGSTSSYARKYALNGLFLIDDNKDPDNHDNRQPDYEGICNHYAQAMQAANDLNQLKSAYQQGAAKLKGSPFLQTLTQIKDEQKVRLTNGN